MCVGTISASALGGSNLSTKIFGSGLGGKIDNVLDYNKYIDPIAYSLGKMAREPNKAPAAPEAPQAPTEPTAKDLPAGTVASNSQAAIEARRRLALSRGRTVMTSPLGVTGTASVGRKTLLGQ